MQQSQTLGESFRSATTNIGEENGHFSGFQTGSDILPSASYSRFDSHGSPTCIENRSSPWLFDNHNMSINLDGLNQVASSVKPETPSVSGWPTSQGPVEDNLVDFGDHGNGTLYSSPFSNNEVFDLPPRDMEPLGQRSSPPARPEVMSLGCPFKTHLSPWPTISSIYMIVGISRRPSLYYFCEMKG